MHQRRRHLIDTGRGARWWLVDAGIGRARRLVRRCARLILMSILRRNEDRRIGGDHIGVDASGGSLGFCGRAVFSLSAADVSRRPAAYSCGGARFKRLAGALCDFSVQRIGIVLGAFGLHPSPYESLRLSVSAIVDDHFVIDLFPTSFTLRNAESLQLRPSAAESHDKVNR